MSSTPPTNPNPNRPPRPAPVVPDYHMERLIGRGSYGEVWLAHSALGTRRAVKVVYRDSFDSERPYLREFAGIRAYEPISSHESQVSVFHVGKNDEAGYFYYVMELADDATTLAKPFPNLAAAEPAGSPPAYEPATLGVLLKQRGRLPCAEALPLARSLASALDRLHGHGLVHRDIKPANIIFVDGRPKLADIGLVTSAAKADTLVGTTGYIPPEGPGTAAADLFSFGKVLYEVVTGHDRQEFPMLPDDLGQLTDREQLLEVNEIILKCCHLDPRERYASGAEVLADLKRIEAGRSLRRGRAQRRQLAVAACVAVAALGWVLVKQFFPPPTTTEPAVTFASAMPGSWTNSLGMVFVPVPGLTVDFSIWETRVQDFRAFVDATGHAADAAFFFERGSPKKLPRRWNDPPVSSDPTFPVRAVSGADARAFCAWLTAQERAAGRLSATQHYRLPRDAEWSWTAGLTNEAGATAAERELSDSNQFYWGTNWPPPAGYGNFAGFESPFAQRMRIEGYADDFSTAAPVGSFPPERHGLFDLAGNVSELCEEWPPAFEAKTPFVRRGATWESYQPKVFEVRNRRAAGLHESTIYAGFRVVCAPVDDAPPPGK
ncbi:MAG: WD-40 repeat-containing serine/threonine protein kinase [Limisphaerales bacterium]|nr:MAG: WD-40 repeat-containing serine/threonine protein kinase [Limisphaerales bacterium]KAG0508856.1 MAG: WD-40 repeat-containing serine/threonine protein kinase [Limisphaerales bacterium]TXT50197.1 MAG: WD-40 repeat-containing serine/threonine protein kinase [Limisphaerales bacterium]